MKSSLYIDRGNPLIEIWPEKLSDNSQAWNITFRGGMSIEFESESKADAAFTLMAQAVKMSNRNVLIL